MVFGIVEVSLGHAAGLATSVLWTGSSVLFTEATRRLGPSIVNTVRLFMAVVLLGITYRLLSGDWIPHITQEQCIYLALSGVIGLSIGDQALFTAFLDVGPRKAMLIMTTAPLFAAFFGWISLGETIEPVAWMGVGLTLAGVAWVVLERPPTEIGKHPPHRVRGIIMAIIAAACQAAGLMFSKRGIGHGGIVDEAAHLSPQAATYVRMAFAAVAMFPMLLLMHHLLPRRTPGPGEIAVVPGDHLGIRRSLKALGNSRGMALTLLATICGPFLGVWMSLVAADRIDLGIAQTLGSLPPVLLLPVAFMLYGERITLRAMAGAALAVAGAALLCLT
ncbi:MAG: DMT family transporter [Phycisphaerales bacterium]